MRRLGQALGVEAMSLYNHARNKEDILNGVVDVIVGEIEIVPRTSDWTTTMRRQVGEARTVLRRHPWMPRVMETRANPGPATMRYLEAVITILREGGFSVDLTHHAMHVLGSRHLRLQPGAFRHNRASRVSSPRSPLWPRRRCRRSTPTSPNCSAAVSHEGGLGGCDDDVEFAFGLDLILEGLERLRAAA